MNSSKLAIQAAGISALVFALAACDGTQATAAPEKAPEVNHGVVFSETFSDSGLFTINKNDLGGYDFSIDARIGSKAEAMMAATANQSSLAEIYRTIHEGKSEVPAVVSEASNWLESRPAPVSEKPDLNPAPAALALEKGASKSAFYDGYCKNFYDGIYVWRSMSCVWLQKANQTYTGGVLGDNFANDRVYAWNSTPYTATMQLWNANLTSQPNTWSPTLQPYWVTWFTWGGTYSNAKAYIKLPTGRTGEIGVSNHSRYVK